MVEKKKSVAPRPSKRPPRVSAPTVRPKKERESKPPAHGGEDPLAVRLARAEEDLGTMLVQLSRAEERARKAEAEAAQPADARIAALVEERDALKAAMREAATLLLRAITPGARKAPPPLPAQPRVPAVVDISEIAEIVESLRPPPTPSDA